MFVRATLLTVACIAAYWLAVLGRGDRRRLPSLSAGLWAAALLAVLAAQDLAGRLPRPYVPPPAPVAVAMAFDLSSSMLARPDPRSHPAVVPRLERAKAVILEVLRDLQEARRPVLVSVSVFTVVSQLVSPWTDDLAQTAQIVEHGIAPELLTRPGTDLAVALNGLDGVFQTLPPDAAAVGGPAPTRLVAILVSDGESTAGLYALPAATARLRARGVEVVALQVGLPGIPEGVPLYDAEGVFQGFLEIGGATYTFPDFEAMVQIASPDGNRGLHVRAEDPDAPSRIAAFLGAGPSPPRPAERLQLVAAWVLWGLVLLGLARML